MMQNMIGCSKEALNKKKSKPTIGSLRLGIHFFDEDII